MSNPTRTLTVAEAARRPADVINRAFYRHETTMLVRHGVPVAYVGPMTPMGIPVRELAHRWPSLPRLSREEADAFASDVAAARAAITASTDSWA